MTSERAVEAPREHIGEHPLDVVAGRLPGCPVCDAATPERREDGWEELRREIEALRVKYALDTDSPDQWDGAQVDVDRLLRLLAAARGEPGLDVERLARALTFTHSGPRSWPLGLNSREFARDIAAEYNRLATPTTPEPDPER